MNSKPRIGVSACLLGHPVRFNGDHKRNDWITKTLASHVALESYCPETFMGLPTPRPALRFVTYEESVRLVESNSKTDHTAAAMTSCDLLAQRADGLHGFILKKDSPSCGIERVKIYGKGDVPSRSGIGVFAAALKLRFPLMPMIEEGRLVDLAQRENFVLRVFAFYEAQNLLSQRENLRMSDLQRFHRKYKLILLEHDQRGYALLGKLVGASGCKPAFEILQEYLPRFMASLETLPTVGTRVNVLQHILGYLRGCAGLNERAQISEAIAHYQSGKLPFIAPLAILFHEVKKHGLAYLLEQKFFSPFPRELGGLVRL